MTATKQYFELELPFSQIHIGEKVGYNFIFSNNITLNPVLYELNTYKEENSIRDGIVTYSDDGGATWNNFALGENGETFTSSVLIRIEVNPEYFNYIIAQKGNTIYQISPDGKRLITYYDLPDYISNFIMGIYEKENIVMAVGENTMFMLKTKVDMIEPFDRSINLHDKPIDIICDSDRGDFWQINNNSVCLKNINGKTIFCQKLDIDTDDNSGLNGIGFGKIGINFGVA